jgi:hypothetical protein
MTGVIACNAVICKVPMIDITISLKLIGEGNLEAVHMDTHPLTHFKVQKRRRYLAA